MHNVNTVTQILLVEDDVQLRTLLSECLGDIGYQVFTADCATYALNQLTEFEGLDVLISDLNLGGPIDGMEIAIRAHDKFPAIETIIISGQPDLFYIKRPRLKNCGFVMKPFRMDSLFNMVHRAAVRNLINQTGK